MDFDPEKPFSYIGGRPPVFKVQDGYGFSGNDVCLGKVDEVGNLIEIHSVGEADLPDEGDQVFETQGVTYSDRESLETLAADLGVKFRANISDEKLKERIEAAKA